MIQLLLYIFFNQLDSNSSFVYRLLSNEISFPLSSATSQLIS